MNVLSASQVHYFLKSPIAANNLTKPCFLAVKKWVHTQHVSYLNFANS